MGNKSAKSELSETDIEMLTSTTGLPRERILKWFKEFKADCKSGVLNKKHFIRFYKELLPNHTDDADKFCEYVFKAFDVNNSGSIDFTEFLLAFSLSANGNLEQKLNWVFDMYDLDDSEFIDVKELKNVLESIYKLMKIEDAPKNSINDRANSIFKQLDANKDKRLSRAEFINGCMNDEFLRCLLAPNI